MSDVYNLWDGMEGMGIGTDVDGLNPGLDPGFNIGDEELIGTDMELIGDLFGDIARAAGSVVKTVVKSPVTKATATGLAFVYPPVGIPATVAVTAASKVVAATESRKPAVRTAARNMVKRTAALSKMGDLQARKGLQLLATVKSATKAKAQAAKNIARRQPPTMRPKRGLRLGVGKKVSGILITPSGVRHGKFTSG